MKVRDSGPATYQNNNGYQIGHAFHLSGLSCIQQHLIESPTATQSHGTDSRSLNKTYLHNTYHVSYSKKQQEVRIFTNYCLVQVDHTERMSMKVLCFKFPRSAEFGLNIPIVWKYHTEQKLFSKFFALCFNIVIPLFVISILHAPVKNPFFCAVMAVFRFFITYLTNQTEIVFLHFIKWFEFFLSSLSIWIIILSKSIVGPRTERHKYTSVNFVFNLTAIFFTTF